MKSLYVGNLPWSTTDDELAEFFKVHGRVISSRIITDKETGRSRGFGFVDVEDEEAETLASAVDGQEFGGRPLKVSVAKPKNT